MVFWKAYNPPEPFSRTSAYPRGAAEAARTQSESSCLQPNHQVDLHTEPAGGGTASKEEEAAAKPQQGQLEDTADILPIIFINFYCTIAFISIT